MRNSLAPVLLVVFALGVCLSKEYFDKLDRYLIACHTTDFKCFQRQYASLRNNVLLGNQKLDIQEYEPYRFKYGDTCIKMSGFEDSELVGMGIESDSRELTMVLELPLKLEQVKNDTKLCADPEKDFKNLPNHTGPLKKFAANATIQVVFPYDLKKKKSNMYMLLGEEGLDVILDIPDLSEIKDLSPEEKTQYELSEWAYSVVPHINAAQAFALPYTSRMRLFTDRIPLERYLILYPEEEYTDIFFSYSLSPFFDMKHSL